MIKTSFYLDPKYQYKVVRIKGKANKFSNISNHRLYRNQNLLKLYQVMNNLELLIHLTLYKVSIKINDNQETQITLLVQSSTQLMPSFKEKLDPHSLVIEDL